MQVSQRVVVTGAAGFVGRCAVAGLADAGHTVVGFDRTHAELPGVAAWHTGDLRDPAALDAALADADVLIHLAANPYNGADFVTQLVPANVEGLYQVVEAAGRARVARLVLASTMQVPSMARHARPAPDHGRLLNWYGLTKRFAEAVAEEAARQRGIEVIAARIGWFVRNADEARAIARHAGLPIYLSPADTQRFFQAVVTTPWPDDARPRFAIVPAVGKQDDDPPMVDLTEAHRFGFVPRDRWPIGSEHLIDTAPSA